MSFLSSLDIVNSALTAQRVRMDVIAQNIANADSVVTSTEEPYRRKVLEFTEIPLQFSQVLDQVQGGVYVSDVIESQNDFRQVYDPDHPLADEEGYVLYSNVDITEEQLDLLGASNSYEASLTTLSVIKAMINKTLEISK